MAVTRELCLRTAESREHAVPSARCLFARESNHSERATLALDHSPSRVDSASLSKVSLHIVIRPPRSLSAVCADSEEHLEIENAMFSSHGMTSCLKTKL